MNLELIICKKEANVYLVLYQILNILSKPFFMPNLVPKLTKQTDLFTENEHNLWCNKENVEFYENSNFGGRVEIMTPSYCNNADINMTLNEREDVWDLFNL